MTLPSDKFVKMREEEKMDKATELLRDQRRAEREAAEYARAVDIVDAVRSLRVDEFANGVAVRFVKRYGGEDNYTFLALRVRYSADGPGTWFVTGRQGHLNDAQFEELLAEKDGFGDFMVIYGDPVEQAAGTLRAGKNDSWRVPSSEVIE